MTSIWGRLIKMLVGMVLSFLGLLPVGGVWGMIFIIVGLVMVLTSALNYCLLAPLFGRPIRPARRD